MSREARLVSKIKSSFVEKGYFDLSEFPDAKILGKGRYGTVYLVKIHGIPVAVKIVRVTKASNSEMKIRLLSATIMESMLLEILTEVVHKGILPSVPLFFWSTQQKAIDEIHIITAIEKCDGACDALLRLNKSTCVLVSFLSQLLWTILIFISGLKLSHCDLYLKNILFKSTDDLAFSFQYKNRKYTFPTGKHLFLVTDFGISHCERISKTKKPEIIKNRKITDVTDIMDCSKNHVLEYNIPQFSYDLVTLFLSVRSLPILSRSEILSDYVYGAIDLLNEKKEDLNDQASSVEVVLQLLDDLHSKMPPSFCPQNVKVYKYCQEYFDSMS